MNASKRISATAYLVRKHTDAEKLVGQFVEVLWPKEEVWYAVFVFKYDEKAKALSVVYDNDSIEVISNILSPVFERDRSIRLDPSRKVSTQEDGTWPYGNSSVG